MRPLTLFLLVALLSGCVPESALPEPPAPLVPDARPAPLLRQTANVGREPTTYRFTVGVEGEGRTLVLLFQTEANAPQMGMRAVVEREGNPVTTVEVPTNPFLETVRFPAFPGDYSVRLTLRSSRNMAVQLYAWLEPGAPLTPEQRVKIWDHSIQLPLVWQGLVTPDDWVTFAGGDDLTLTIGPAPGNLEARPATIGAAVQAALAHITGSTEPSPIDEPVPTGVVEPALKTRIGTREHWIYVVPAGKGFVSLILESGGPEDRREGLLQAGAAMVRTLELDPTKP